ncbi:MAG TPA: A/G-specific adenine glycosylase [Saprospiraceae bacterium]|nr:A/G-specific adenine glycosylase [Saprospiraceae bacterium]
MNLHLEALYSWHDHVERDLPWKEGKDPYKIWLSEIILQQTRVEQGKPYYLRFIHKWPTIYDLAAASEDEVLSMWQGLGYYSRGRNLLKTAQVVVSQYNGQFPKDIKEIVKLPGIGSYTAAAILSFAHDLPHPVIDGNVKRVIARWFDIDVPIDSSLGIKNINTLLTQVFDCESPARFNQAIMDFGALQCTPQPKCASCNMSKYCISYKNETTDLIPIKEKIINVKHRYFHFLFILVGDQCVITRRSNSDIWHGLYQFPLFESEHITTNDIKYLINDIFGKDIQGFNVVAIDQGKHKLTHQVIHYHIYQINLGKLDIQIMLPPYQLIKIKEIDKFGFPQLLKKFLDRYFVEPVL